jgi:hypothetical protein
LRKLVRQGPGRFPLAYKAKHAGLLEKLDRLVYSESSEENSEESSEEDDDDEVDNGEEDSEEGDEEESDGNGDED